MPYGRHPRYLALSHDAKAIYADTLVCGSSRPSEIMNHGSRHTPVEAVKAAIDELHRAGLMRTDEHGAVWIDDLSDWAATHHSSSGASAFSDDPS